MHWLNEALKSLLSQFSFYTERRCGTEEALIHKYHTTPEKKKRKKKAPYLQNCLCKPPYCHYHGVCVSRDGIHFHYVCSHMCWVWVRCCVGEHQEMCLFSLKVRIGPPHDPASFWKSSGRNPFSDRWYDPFCCWLRSVWWIRYEPALVCSGSGSRWIVIVLL